MTLQNGFVVADIERDQTFDGNARLDRERGAARTLEVKADIVVDQRHDRAADRQHLVQFHAHDAPPR